MCVIDTNLQKKIFSSHSQYLEDVFIDCIFKGKKEGFYVDIGANDPDIISNTKKFYDLGWTGVNVEPNTKVFNKLSVARPRDINLNLGIGPQTGKMIFYELNPDTLSSFCEKTAKENVKIHNATIVSSSNVDVITLKELFCIHCGDNKIDFMTIDSEGLEVKILSSNDWVQFRPAVIVAELTSDSDGELISFMGKYEYSLVYYNGTNGIFIDRQADLMA